MEFTIEREIFLKGIQRTLGVVERGSAVPILKNLLIRASGEASIEVAATDREIGIVTGLQASVIEEGKMTVPAKKLYETVREMSGETVHAVRDKKDVMVLTCNRAVFRLCGLPAEEYPEYEDSASLADSPSFKMSGILLKEMIQRVSFAVSTDEQRKNISGVLLEKELVDGGKWMIRMVGTDGHRLAVMKSDSGEELLVPDNKTGVILPRKGLTEIRKLIDDEEGEVAIAIRSGKIVVKNSRTVLSVSLIDDTFPDYRRVIPVMGDNPHVRLGTGVFLHTLKRMAVINPSDVFIDFGSALTVLTTTNPDCGEVRDEIEAAFPGPATTMRFNVGYPLVTAALGTDSFLCVQGGRTKRVTNSVLKALFGNGADFFSYKAPYNDTAGYRGGQMLNDKSGAKKTVTFKGSNNIPIKIGTKWFFPEADVDITIPADLDDYLADDVVESGVGVWTPAANVTFSTDTAKVKLAVAAGFTTGLVGTIDFSAKDFSLTGKNAISFLIKSDTTLAGGVLQFVYDEHAACASPSESLNIPPLKANVETRVILSLAAASSARDAVISIGLNAVSDPGTVNLWISDIRTTSIEAGKDYNVYACDNSGTLVFKASKASTYPAGFAAATSRKEGGFHTLPLAVGTIASHNLTDYDTADINPYTIWDLKHRTRCGNNTGMTFSPKTGKWVQIYLASGTGTSMTTVNGGTISDNRNWMDFVDDGAVCMRRLLTDGEFQIMADGSNQLTNIFASADPVTTGPHIDTAGRRMISNIGCEDICGVENQWLQDQSYQYTPNGTSVVASQTSTVTHAASPGGTQVYMKFLTDGTPYLCCNFAAAQVDKILTFGSAYKIPVKHDAGANTGLPIYFDDDGAQPNRILCNNTTYLKDVFIMSNNPDYWLSVTHNASAATTGVALNYDDGADNRLEANMPGAANATIDLSVGTGWSYYALPGSKGQLYQQGSAGDVKLVAGGGWNGGTGCGSRCRGAVCSRWHTNSDRGARFASEPL